MRLLWQLRYVRLALRSPYEITAREAWQEASASWEMNNDERGSDPMPTPGEAIYVDGYVTLPRGEIETLAFGLRMEQRISLKYWGDKLHELLSASPDALRPSAPVSNEDLAERLRAISTNMPGHVDAGTVWDAADAIEAAGSTEPVAWVSPGQFANLKDDIDEGGIYLPVRKYRVGNFTMPLYAAPASVAGSGATLASVEAAMQQLMEDTRDRPGMPIGEWIATRMKDAADKALAAPASDGLRAAGERFLQLKRSIMIDVGSCHANRGPGASSEMRSDDRDLRNDIEEAYRLLEAALSQPQSGEIV